jgi:hypothetical protein
MRHGARAPCRTIRVVTTCNLNSASLSHAIWQTDGVQYLRISHLHVAPACNADVIEVC